MTDEPIDKSFMFWSSNPAIHYGDEYHTPIPRRVYRCKGTVKVTKTASNAVQQPMTHSCKLVTDHPRNTCLCICGQEFNDRSESV